VKVASPILCFTYLTIRLPGKQAFFKHFYLAENDNFLVTKNASF